MDFTGVYHYQRFWSTLRFVDPADKDGLVVCYLLTADTRLFRTAKRSIERRDFSLRDVRPKNCSEDGYALFTATRDLIHDTGKISLSDLADQKQFSYRTLTAICNAVQIKRIGLNAIHIQEKNGKFYASCSY